MRRRHLQSIALLSPYFLFSIYQCLYVLYIPRGSGTTQLSQVGLYSCNRTFTQQQLAYRFCSLWSTGRLLAFWGFTFLRLLTKEKKMNLKSTIRRDGVEAALFFSFVNSTILFDFFFAKN